MSDFNAYVREAVVENSEFGGKLEAAERLAAEFDGDVRVIENFDSGEVVIEGVYPGSSVSDGWGYVATFDPEYGDVMESVEKVAASLTADDLRVVYSYSDKTAYLERKRDE